MSSTENVEQDRRVAVDTYFRLLQHHTDFIERTHETFNNIESHLYQLILQYNDEIEEIPLRNRTMRTSVRNNNSNARNNNSNSNVRNSRTRTPSSLFNNINNRSNASTGTNLRNPFSSTPLVNELGTSRRRSPAFTPSQNVLDTITLWALFPNGISNNNNLESLSPVIVRPSEAQIREATENMNYGDVIDPVNRTCPISQEEFQDNDEITVIRHCGHIFRQNDFQTWFQSNVRCPLCRYDIREYRRGGGGALSRQNSMRRVNSDNSETRIRMQETNPGDDTLLTTPNNEEQSDSSNNDNVGPSANNSSGANSSTGANNSSGANSSTGANSSSGANSSTGANSSASTNSSTGANTFSSLGNNDSFQFYTASNGNNWLDLINENMSRVIQTSDISDNINVNFEYSYIMPNDYIRDISDNNQP